MTMIPYYDDAMRQKARRKGGSNNMNVHPRHRGCWHQGTKIAGLRRTENTQVADDCAGYVQGRKQFRRWPGVRRGKTYKENCKKGLLAIKQRNFSTEVRSTARRSIERGVSCHRSRGSPFTAADGGIREPGWCAEPFTDATAPPYHEGGRDCCPVPPVRPAFIRALLGSSWFLILKFALPG
jgi:hypothetical protein